MNRLLPIQQTNLASSARGEEYKEAPQQQGERTPAKVDINEMGGSAKRHVAVEVVTA